MSTQVSGAYRALEIILGIVAILVGILALIYPTGFFVALVVLFGIALIVIGILRIATAASSHWLSSGARSANAVIGIIALIIGIVILFFPGVSAVVVILLIGIGLLIYGIGRIAVGATANNMNGGLRGLLIVLGILIVVFSLIVIFFPVIGAWTYAFFASIIFILIGIESLAAGIAGASML